MSVVEQLAAAISELEREGYEPEKLCKESSVKNFADLLGSGARTWTRVAEAVAAAPPDFEEAGQLLRTRLTFENTGNPYITSFEQDVRIAADSRALGSRIAVDTFLLAVGPLRPALFRAEQVARAAVDGVLSDASELAALPSRIEGLRNRAERARTSWGRERLLRRAETLAAHADDARTRRSEGIVLAQEKVAAFASDVKATVALFESAFGVDCHRSPTTP